MAGQVVLGYLTSSTCVQSERLQAGDRIITGGIVGAEPPGGAHVAADFGRLGGLEVTLSA